MSQNMKALQWQLMQSKLSVLMPSFITLAENFCKWRPYLELFLGGHREARNFTAPWNRSCSCASVKRWPVYPCCAQLQPQAACPSVRPFVCPFVTRWYWLKTKNCRIMQFYHRVAKGDQQIHQILGDSLRGLQTSLRWVEMGKPVIFDR